MVDATSRLAVPNGRKKCRSIGMENGSGRRKGLSRKALTPLPGYRYGGLFTEPGVWAVDKILDFDGFLELFKNRAVVFTDLPAGRARELAERVNERAGRGDATIRTPAEFEALFGELTGADPAAGARLTVRDGAGALTAEGAILQEYLRVAGGADNFFDQPMWVVSVADWPAPDVLLEKAVTSSGGARLDVWRADPADPRPIPPAGASGVLFTSATFSLMNSGNRTLLAPKRSWKIDVEPGDDDDQIVGLARLNLKSMYNDPSQMREALAWDLFARPEIPAARHTYARLAINGCYRGLYSMIEQVDRPFLRSISARTTAATCTRPTAATSAAPPWNTAPTPTATTAGNSTSARPRRPHLPAEDERGRRRSEHLRRPGHPDPHDQRGRAARRWSTVSTPTRSAALCEDVLDVAIVPALGRRQRAARQLGQLLRHPGELLPVQRRPARRPRNPHDALLHVHPVGLRQQLRHRLLRHRLAIHRSAGLARQHRHTGGGPDRTSRIPLVQNILANHDFAQYYLDHLEYLLDTAFTPAAVAERMGTPDGNGLWQRINQAAYLEADTPYSAPFTGRQFTNDEVFRAGYAQEHLQHGNSSIEGIYHFVRMRYDSARTQVHALRATYPAGASGARFGAASRPVPAGV